MNRSPFTMPPEAFAFRWTGDSPPFAVIYFDDHADFTGAMVAPPFPLIGIGDAAHPLAAQVDCRVEAPVTLSMIEEGIIGELEAATVLVQLLRLIESLPIDQALASESLAYGVLQGSKGHADWLAWQTPAAPPPPGRVLVERTGDSLDIFIDRPQAHNAIDRDMRDALREAFEVAVYDADIGQIVLRGAGRAFSVGADLSEFGTTRDPATAHTIRTQTLPAHAIAQCADRLSVHIQGACIGSGLEMAAFARRVTAFPKAWFQLPELTMGLIPGAGGCVSVSRRIGRHRAVLMILSGKRIPAETALEWGLIDAIVDH